jgi:hypothetical protein
VASVFWYAYRNEIWLVFKPAVTKTPPVVRPSVWHAVAVLGSVLIANIAVLQGWPGPSGYIAGAVATVVLSDVIVWRQRRPQGGDAFFFIMSGICLVGGILNITDYPRRSR